MKDNWNSLKLYFFFFLFNFFLVNPCIYIYTLGIGAWKEYYFYLRNFQFHFLPKCYLVLFVQTSFQYSFYAWTEAPVVYTVPTLVYLCVWIHALAIGMIWWFVLFVDMLSTSNQTHRVSLETLSRLCIGGFHILLLNLKFRLSCFVQWKRLSVIFIFNMVWLSFVCLTWSSEWVHRF